LQVTTGGSVDDQQDSEAREHLLRIKARVLIVVEITSLAALAASFLFSKIT
jgi:hypothetical protein